MDIYFAKQADDILQDRIGFELLASDDNLSK